MSLDYTNNKSILERVKRSLRQYQINAIAHGIKRKTILLDMYMGYGKTVCALTIMFVFKPRKVLVLCGSNALGNFIHEVRKWFPEYAVPEEFIVIRAKGKNAAKRRKEWAREGTFYICTKETFIRDAEYALQNDFDVYVIDEAHKIPKHTTKTYKALEKGLRGIDVKIMMTGTWFKRHPGNGWRQLHMLQRSLFSSYWRFVNTFCTVIDGYFGKEIIKGKNPEGFAQAIDTCVFRYHVKDGSVPESVRKFNWVDMSPQQERIYRELSEDMFTLLDNGTLLISQVSVVTFTRHNQLLTCPKILDDSLGLGTALEEVLKLLEETEDDPEEQHFVIFTPYRLSVAVIVKELEARGYPVFEITSGMDPEEIHQKTVAFRALKGQKSAVVSTINFAESFNLGTSTRSHFLGIIRDKGPLEQAEARLARADSDLFNTVIHRYWLYNNTLHEHSVDVLNERSAIIKKQFKTYDDLKEELAGIT